MTIEMELAIREQFRRMASLGFTVYPTGVEYPPLTEDEYVAAARLGRRVDLCRERGAQIRFWDGVIIGP
ncbi:MAG: hypothetical protein JNK29_11830 [Anaerolineales bacterium]|nr:hypothetical protein [Anaerolineales bacterium]